MFSASCGGMVVTRDDRFEFDEGFQRGFALDDATSFTRLMLEIYENRCAFTRRQFPPADALPHPDLDIYLLQPLADGGELSFHNALVVERPVSRLLDEGQLWIDVDLAIHDVSGKIHGSIWRHADRAFWPSLEALAQHRTRIGR
jgi:hypothetical protein